jgi:hypothetical protein
VACALTGAVDGVVAPFPAGLVPFIYAPSPNVISVTAAVGVNAPVGDYNLTCTLSGGATSFAATKRILILFNAHARDDGAP